LLRTRNHLRAAYGSLEIGSAQGAFVPVQPCHVMRYRPVSCDCFKLRTRNISTQLNKKYSGTLYITIQRQQQHWWHLPITRYSSARTSKNFKLNEMLA